MKWLFVLVILCVSIGFSQQALSRDQIEEMAKKMLEECAKKEGASDDDVKSAIAHQPPKTKPEKCLHACMGETLGLIQNKKPNVEASVELAKMAFGADDPKVEQSRKIAAACAHMTADDRCEAAVQMYECSIDEAKKLGIEFKDLL
ncbi:general odorant-binding protein 28a-like [Contarinia nasturtii]|uniref:general odorant-binding protein 28a-like n=1 Tax=Contarinia nasturtii TaxID=265458 RepID=UPI0012D45C47|nr:general odorant-binding protein 28a-like [Contarinia nasturtii]